MAMATSSPLLKIIGIGVAISALFVIFKMSGNSSDAVQSGDRTPFVPTTPEDLDETPETIRTLSAQVTRLRSELGQLNEKNAELEQQKQQIERNLSSELQSQIDSVKEQQAEQSQNIFNRIAGRIDEIVLQGNQQPQPAIVPQVSTTGTEEPVPTPPPTDTIVWVEPLYKKPAPQPVQTQAVTATTQVQPTTLPITTPNFVTQTVGNVGTAVTVGQQGLLGRIGQQSQQQDPVLPVHTIPANATLIDSTLMTAMIGRVPFGGPLKEPFPFKVIIGAENLASNGIKIPRVVNMIASGTTTGDWTLSCVRGTIDSVTFTFEDGTIQTIDSGGLGYISDPQGIPCVPGKKISNATSFIIGRMLAAMTTGVAGTFAKSEIQEDVSLFGTASNVSNAGKHATFSAAKSAAQELQDYIKERQSLTFDAIFVNPGEKVAIHIQQQIPIDYNPKGRKVFHDEVDYSNIRANID